MQIDGAFNLQHAPIDHLLVKLATRCNINCKYCYWFRDQNVYQFPKQMTDETQKNLTIRLKEHLIHHRLEEFFIFFHGGEPLLYGKERFRQICLQLDEMVSDIPTKLHYGVTTNGLLLDDEWITLLKKHNVKVSLSLDGTQAMHDKNRVDFRGGGTYDRVIAALKLLNKHDALHGILAVCEPNSNPTELLDLFYNDLNITRFDILIPDENHESIPASIANYYIKLFDCWYDNYASKGVSISIIDSFIRVVLGKRSRTQAIGYGPITTVTLMTDGTLQAVDMLNICGDGFLGKEININKNALIDIKKDRVYQESYNASLNLAEECQRCQFREPCGGGPLQTRWSNKNRFNNPSVYCQDIKAILRHVDERVHQDLIC